jgi:hypothetical protein
MNDLASTIDRVARWTATRRAPASPDIAIEGTTTRRDIVAGAAVAASILVAPRLLGAPPALAAESRSLSCQDQCNARRDASVAEGQKGCDAAADDFERELRKRTSGYFGFSAPMVRMQYRVLCYEGVLIRAAAEAAACRAACARGSTPANVARATKPPIAPPPPPPPPNCPGGTYFCSVSAAGGDICCVNGDSCCACGICCVPVAKCACCG